MKKSKYDRLILITSADISSSIYDSHVISLLEYLNNTYDIRLALFSFGKTDLHKEDKISTEKIHHLKKILREENIFFFSKKNIFSPYEQKERIKGYINKFKNEKIFIFCQNYYAGFLGCLIKKEIRHINLHVDFKGIVPEEHLFYDDSIFVKRIPLYIGGKIFERYIFKYSDSFSVVSNSFKHYFQKKYNIGNRPFFVLPSAVNTNNFYYNEKIRETYRKKLSCEDKDIIITYSGSFQEWQQPDKIFEFFKQTTKFDKYKFLILTLDVDKAEKLSKKHKLPENRIKIFACPLMEVNNFLNASDICLLLRKNDIVNNVASPTKFGEYMVTKNKIIISKGVGDFSEIVADSQYGLCLDNLSLDIDDIIKKIEINRKPTNEEINDFKKEYSIEKNLAKIGNIIEGQRQVT